MAAHDRVTPDELREELKSQITTFKNAMGALPDHLDAHHFVHLYPPLFDVYLDLAESFNLPARLPFPRQEAALDHMPPILGNLPPETAKQIGRADQKILAARAIKSTDHFVAAFYDKTVSVPFLLEILASLPQGSSELMTHPGLLDDQLRAESRYSLQREDELAVLTNAQVIEYLDTLDVKLCTFADL